MSSALRFSIIIVLFLATTALGLLAYNMNQSKPAPAALAEKGPAGPSTVGYFVAARPLPRGTLVRDEDFSIRSVTPENVPAGAIVETPESKMGLPGSLVRKFVEAGRPVTLQDILRPRDQGFLASVLAPDTGAISIKVDEESGVSGLIRPGDYVDVVLTQVFEKEDAARRALSQTVLSNVRVIAIDQEITQGGRPISAVAGKQAQTVSLELAQDQVKKITVAKKLGTLSLAVRAAVERWDPAAAAERGSGCESPELARTAVVVHSGGEVKQYSVRKQDLDDGEDSANCADTSDAANRTAAATGYAGKMPEKR